MHQYFLDFGAETRRNKRKLLLPPSRNTQKLKGVRGSIETLKSTHSADDTWRRPS